MFKVSVIIVTIGAKDYIKSSLDSVFKQTSLPQEVIVIDNSLKPELGLQINKLYPLVKVYSEKENLFYSLSLNKGIDSTRGEFVLCLNDDVVLERDFIQEALKAFLVNNKIGLVGGRMLRSKGEILDSTGLFLTPWRSAKDRGYGMASLNVFDEPGFIFGVNGAAAFYRRKMLEEIKEGADYFDSRFRMFYEDMDISWRANKKGWRAYYFPSAVARHVRGGSFRPDCGIDKAVARRYLDEHLHYELIKNRYLTILKNETFSGFILHLLPVLIYELHLWAYILFFQPKLIKVVFGNLKKILSERKKSF
ncbi:MAG: glycosyltransferase family 2 protein [Candidatus Omnitrophica bacterium]|nr:glycosyltransferase family 2 protein [Candidatus Omnitrophota bacterium]MDD5660753.1 glycosyltransferase family 2 protein [Candidatus Omnitrophota bacterium]